MNVLRALYFLLQVAVATLLPSPSSAAEDYYAEVPLRIAVQAIADGSVEPRLRSNIEGVATALSYVYDCSEVSPGFLRSMDRVSAALVEYSKAGFGSLSGPEYGNLTVAGALHAYVTLTLKCTLRR